MERQTWHVLERWDRSSSEGMTGYELGGSCRYAPGVRNQVRRLTCQRVEVTKMSLQQPSLEETDDEVKGEGR
jgi:hypothetical protein